MNKIEDGTLRLPANVENIDAQRQQHVVIMEDLEARNVKCCRVQDPLTPGRRQAMLRSRLRGRSARAMPQAQYQATLLASIRCATRSVFLSPNRKCDRAGIRVRAPTIFHKNMNVSRMPISA